MTYTANELEVRFKRAAMSRISQKKLGESKYTNDAGYWDGGYCEWGGTHNLSKDCQTLANFFTGITELRNARKELINFNNQPEFNKNKQSLLTKINDALNGLQMKTSSSTSIAGVCCIWSDFVSLWKEKLDEFRKDLERLKTDIERVSYNEAKELLKLNIEERNLKNEIEENQRRANNETDDNKKKAFTLLVDQATEDLKKLLERKQQLKTARLGDDFNPDQHIDNFLKKLEEKLSGRNRPPRPTHNPTNPHNGANPTPNSQPNDMPGANEIPVSNNNQEKPFLEKYWKELILGGVFLLGVYYILNEKESHEKTN